MHDKSLPKKATDGNVSEMSDKSLPEKATADNVSKMPDKILPQKDKGTLSEMPDKILLNTAARSGIVSFNPVAQSGMFLLTTTASPVKESSELGSKSDKCLLDLASKYGSLSLKYRRLFLALLPEINRRELYRQAKMSSIYEYAAKIAGVSRETVNKVIRISIRLEDKPVLKAKFEKGEIGHAKLELIAPIATPATDKIWADKAENMSKAALETHIRDLKREDSDMSTELPGDENRLESFRIDLKPETAARGSAA
jgi:hypothetical protein